MRWQDREGSNNVEDARGGSGGGGGKPLGIIGLIILLIGAYNGVDLSGLVGGPASLAIRSNSKHARSNTHSRSSSCISSARWYCARRKKCGARIFKKWAKRIKSLCCKFIRAQREQDAARGKPARARFIALRIISYTLIYRFTTQ